jgi:FAD/FMN-containing dehydrogenase
MGGRLDHYGDGSPGQAEKGNGAMGARADQRAGTDRREFLRTAGMAGAAVLLPGSLAAAKLAHDGTKRAAAARPVWLTSFSAGPSKQDWYALRKALSTHLLIQPGQRAYNEARQLFDPAYDSLKPAGVAYCGLPSDVAACVSFVTRFKLPVRVRCGGHSYAGWSSVSNGLIIDVSKMNSMRFGAGTVTVGTGIDLINFYGGLAARGVAVPGGSCPTVGIAGLTLGGGIGVLSRQFGLTCDALESVQMVLADGSVVNADARQHSDLLWASRGGGGGNFGVATAFTFGTHPLSNLVVFFLEWPWSQAARVVNAWQSWVPSGPDALWSNLHLSATTGGRPQPVSIGGTYVGSISAAARELDRLYALIGSHPSFSYLNSQTYLQAMLYEANCAQVKGCDTPPGGKLPFEPFYAKSDFFTRKLNGAGINALLSGIQALARVKGARGGAGSIAFDALGGAVNKVKADATAFVHRDALFLAQYYTGWTWAGSTQPAASQYKWLTSYYNAVHPHASGQAYQNYIDPALPNWQQAYYGSNYGKLQLVKATYDPHQLFRFPQSIAPLTTLGCGTGADC